LSLYASLCSSLLGFVIAIFWEEPWVPIDLRNHARYKSRKAGRHRDKPRPLPRPTTWISIQETNTEKAKRTGNGINYSNNDPKSRLRVSQRTETMRGSRYSSLSQGPCARRTPRRARGGSMGSLTRRGWYPAWVWCRRPRGRLASAVRRGRRRCVVLSRRVVLAKEVSRSAGGRG